MRNLIFLLAVLFLSCDPIADPEIEVPEVSNDSVTEAFAVERLEIEQYMEELLFDVGNYNAHAMRGMVSENANIGLTFYRDGEWHTREMTIDDYFAIGERDDLQPFSEIPYAYDMIITEGRMAVVTVEVKIHRFGRAGKGEVNHLILMKEKNNWKMMSVAWTVHDLPEDEKEFDIQVFARSYAQSWGSGRPEFVAMYFAEDGSLQVNDEEAAIGQEAIEGIARSFMTDIPDMHVALDSLVEGPDGIEFHWTLTGTYSGPNGNGNPIHISGYEVWEMNEEERIQSSKGHFDAEEYARQLAP
jgi:predicted ester cyclase